MSEEKQFICRRLGELEEEERSRYVGIVSTET